MKKAKAFWVVILVLVVGANVKAAPLNGIYSIDPNGSGMSNFLTWNSAVAALHAEGVSGPVVFKVADGTYVEQVMIGLISGVSAANVIRFESASGDSSKAMLTYPTSVFVKDTVNYTLRLYNARFIQFHQLGFSRTGTGRCKNVIHIDSMCGFISFTNNYLHGANASVTNIAPHYIMSTQGWGDHDTLVIENNLFRSGYASVGMGNGLSNMHSQHIRVRNNYVDSAYGSTIEVSRWENVYITDNVIKGNRGWGIFTSTNIGDISVERNIIRQTGTGAGTGIRVEDWSPHNFSDARVANNIIDIEGIGGSGGIIISVRVGSNSYNRDILVAHNSIRLSGADVTNTGILFNVEQTSPYYLLNNNINVNQGLCFRINASNVFTNLVKACNYNNFYTTGTNVAQFQNSKYKTLTEWRNTLLALDMNSVSVNPVFTASPYLVPTAPAFNNKGTPTSVTLDYFGSTRNVTRPDIGAVEFEPVYFDAGTGLVGTARNLSLCEGEVLEVKGKLFNYSNDTLTSAQIGWAVGPTLQNSTAWTGTIAPHDSLEVKFGDYPITPGNTVSIRMFIALPNGLSDSVTRNDTAMLQVARIAKPDASFTFLVNGTVASFSPNDSVGTTSYWDFGNGDTSTKLKPTLDFDSAGDYTVTHIVKNAGGCSDTAVLVVNVIVNGWGEKMENKVKVFPNPFQTEINLEPGESIVGNARVEVYDMQGRLIYLNEGQIIALKTLELSSLIAGSYILKLKTPERVYSLKLIKTP